MIISMNKYKEARLMHLDDDSHPQFILDNDDRKKATKNVSLWTTHSEGEIL